jgi:hypothetical protein
VANKSRVRQIFWGLGIAIVASPIVILFNHVGMPEFARPTYFAFMVIVVVVKVCWELHRRPWFWVTIIAIAGIHVLILIFTAQRLFRTTFPVMFFLGIVDFVVIVAIITLIERVIDGKDGHLLQKKSV